MLDKDEIDAFDAMMPEETELDLYAQKNEDLDNKVAHLTHRVFAQTEAGRELLEIWKQSVLMIPSDQFGMEPFNLGKHEGYNEHIRGIIRIINQVEKEDV